MKTEEKVKEKEIRDDRTYKVVIVDDDRTAIDCLRRALNTTYPEFEIKGTAANGAKGRKLIMDLRPDLLFLDVELPDIQGIQLLGEMRDDVMWDMKVVFYTAYNKYLLQALRESAFDYLKKPFSPQDLAVVMERYRKVASQVVSPSSFASSITALMPQRDTFIISTVTGYKLLHLEEIGYFEYLKEKRLWQVTLFNQSRLALKNNTRAEDIVGYSSSFVQISQSAIINVNYLAMINGKQCQLYPPFNGRDDLQISRSFLKTLQEKFPVI